MRRLPGTGGWARLLCLAAVVTSLALAPAMATPAAGNLLSATTATAETVQATPEARSPADPLVLAHYYIWFTPTSWNRAKTDVPLAGRYSSDNADTMRRHIQDAKRAGIDGFIVSWKSSDILNERLATLVAVAKSENFKLALTYQGLNFNRNQLPEAQISADLAQFAAQYSTDPVFNLFGKPLVVLTGTPVMDPAKVRAITGPLRERMLILGTEKNVEGYERIADSVDGNLYYWSSVNPTLHNGYESKLQAFGTAVHAHHGIWIAPAAPGFDARLVGGKSVVDRGDGETLKIEWQTAVKSMPDAIGIISWNEFSENTYIEPSENYGHRYLDVVSDLTGARAPVVQMDSSDNSGGGSIWRAALAIIGFLGVFGMSIAILMRRQASANARIRAGGTS